MKQKVFLMHPFYYSMFNQPNTITTSKNKNTTRLIVINTMANLFFSFVDTLRKKAMTNNTVNKIIKISKPAKELASVAVSSANNMRNPPFSHKIPKLYISGTDREVQVISAFVNKFVTFHFAMALTDPLSAALSLSRSMIGLR